MKWITLLSLLVVSAQTLAYEAQFTKGQLLPELTVMVEAARNATGVGFEADDFLLIEDRQLATSHYQFYVQTSQDIPVARTAIRIWSHPQTKELILAELHLDEAARKNQSLLLNKFIKAKFSKAALSSKALNTVIGNHVDSVVKNHPSDNQVLGLKSKDMWVNGDLVRQVEVRGRRGVHHISISLLLNRVVEKTYREFPQSETLHAHVFPIYEEVEGTGEKLPYEVRELKFVDTTKKVAGDAPFGRLGNTIFPEHRYHPLLAETAIGEGMGLWSETSLRRQIEKLVNNLPDVGNTLADGVLLQGKYATINLHPAIKEAFKDINFPLNPGVNHVLSWVNNGNGYEARPVSGLQGKTITSQEELLARLPERLADHNPVSYINNGFDEVQVYYGVTVLMDALAEMGFTDPELSTKPFHAFLYDPDIGMRDNAYYTDNTINFTTYNSNQPNLARDNPTIWHELGHGVMDRLMGAHLGFADSKGGYGGLSEGMADFVAKLVVEHQTNGADFPGKNDFRIMNQTGFYLTNEFHDEGEAYGGAMGDMLEIVLKSKGREGLSGLTDLTLEAMRLTRNHPALSAREWYKHMLYADELGSEFRAPGEFKNIILEALSARNFSFESSFKPAEMKVTFNGTELTNASMASRERPIRPCDLGDSVSYDLEVKLTAGDAKFLTFPAIVKVEYKKGALQGAIRWEGEESNPTVYHVNSEADLLKIPLKASMTCENANQPDGSCKDYAYLQVYREGDLKPRAKKRFYLNIGTCK